jgi:hypothetical protein
MKKLKEYKELVNKVEQARDEKTKEELDKWDKLITEIKPQ